VPCLEASASIERALSSSTASRQGALVAALIRPRELRSRGRDGNGPFARARWGPSGLVDHCYVCLYGDGWTLVLRVPCLSEINDFCHTGGPDRCPSRVRYSPRLLSIGSGGSSRSRHSCVTAFRHFFIVLLGGFLLSFMKRRAPWILQCMLPVKTIVGTNI
jgi:hypothetical protein